jgi:hypothetical protein
VHANDLDTLRPAYRAAHASGATLVYDAHELSVEGGNYRWWQLPIMRRRERRFSARADGWLTVNHRIGDELSERYGIPKPVVLYNAPTDRVDRAAPVHRPVRLIFQGQFFYDRNLGELVRAMSRLRGRAVLTLQGWGEAEPELRRGLPYAALRGPPEPGRKLRRR